MEQDFELSAGISGIDFITELGKNSEVTRDMIFYHGNESGAQHTMKIMTVYINEVSGGGAQPTNIKVYPSTGQELPPNITEILTTTLVSLGGTVGNGNED